MVRDKIIFPSKITPQREVAERKRPRSKEVIKFCSAAEITKQELKPMAESNCPQTQIDAVYSQKHSTVKPTPQKCKKEQRSSLFHSSSLCTRCGSKIHTDKN